MAFNIPILFHSHSRTIVQSLRHKQFWSIEDSDCALLVIESISNLSKAHVTHDSSGFTIWAIVYSMQ